MNTLFTCGTRIKEKQIILRIANHSQDMGMPCHQQIRFLLLNQFDDISFIVPWLTHNVAHHHLQLLTLENLNLRNIVATNIPTITVAIYRPDRGNGLQIIDNVIAEHITAMPYLITLLEESKQLRMDITVRIREDSYLLHNLCFTVSNSTIPVATETFNDLMVPTIGILIASLHIR